jgi:hypothetical protein
MVNLKAALLLNNGIRGRAGAQRCGVIPARRPAQAVARVTLVTTNDGRVTSRNRGYTCAVVVMVWR